MEKSHVPDGMPVRLYWLLHDMHRCDRKWSPRLGYPSVSVGLSCGGRVTDDGWEEFAQEADRYALKIVRRAWDRLGVAHRTIVEIRMGWMGDVAVVREGVWEEAIRDLSRWCAEWGVVV